MFEHQVFAVPLPVLPNKEKEVAAMMAAHDALLRAEIDCPIFGPYDLGDDPRYLLAQTLRDEYNRAVLAYFS